MHSVFVALLLCILSTFFPETRAIAKELCEAPPYNGATSGGRCYFAIKITNGTTWPHAWKLCEAMNGTLAQIHTSIEYVKVIDVIGAAFAKATWVWIALQRDHSDMNIGNCSITNSTTFWYDDATTRIPTLNAGKSWVITQRCGDHTKSYANGPEFYMAILARLQGSPSFIGDVPEEGGSPASDLPHVSDNCQTYDQSDMCITETPIENFPDSDPQDCSNRCSREVWCRSFNLMLVDGTGDASYPGLRTLRMVQSRSVSQLSKYYDRQRSLFAL